MVKALLTEWRAGKNEQESRRPIEEGSKARGLPCGPRKHWNVKKINVKGAQEGQGRKGSQEMARKLSYLNYPNINAMLILMCFYLHSSK